MALANIKQAHKLIAYFTANPTLILLDGQIVWLKDNSGTFKKGDGITQLSVLPFLGGASSQTLAQTLLIDNKTGGLPITSDNLVSRNNIQATYNSVEFDNGVNVGEVNLSNNTTSIIHTLKIDLSAPLIEVSQDPTTALGISTKQYADTKVGLTAFKINFRNIANTITSFFTNSNTVARTYTFPDKDITVAGLIDITGINSGTNTGDNATNTQYSGLASSKENTITGTASADFWSGAKTFINFATTVRSTLLTGLSVAISQAIVATDSVLLALGYLQAQVTANTSSIATKQSTLVSGSNIRTVNGSTLLGSTDLQVGTILGTLGITGIYGVPAPYSSGTANTVTSSSNYLIRDVGVETKIVMDNRSTLCDQAIVFLEGGSQASGMEYFGSGYTSTQFPGANLLYRASTLQILNGNNQDKAIVITGTPIINYCGVTGTNSATRLDVTGLRIGTASDCHTTNLNAFTVQGKTFLGSNATALSTLHLSAGSASANSAPFQLSNGTRETVARGGVMEYENNWYKTNNSLVRYGVGGTIFDFFADVTVGGAEADIFSSSLIASTFAVNKDKITAVYSGNFVTAGTQLTQLKAIFAGTTIWDSTAVAPSTGTTSWKITIELMRKSATVVLYTVTLNTTGASGYVYCKSGELSGLTLTNANILKITGLSSGVGSGVGDIIGKQGSVDFKPAS